MGCKSSTQEKPEEKQEPPEEKAVRNWLLAYHRHVKENCQDAEAPLLRAFLSTCVEVLKLDFHVKADASVSVVKKVSEALGEPFKAAGSGIAEDYCCDDGMLKELVAWERNASKLDDESKATILKALFLPQSELPNLKSYDDLLRINFKYSQQPQLAKLFEELAEGQNVLSVDAFCRFLKEQGYEREVAGNAKHKIRTCFGGQLTKYQFCSYYGSPHTNSVLDPQRAQIVFQDMTQPLCSYSIRSSVVEGLEGVKQGLTNGVRAYIFRLSKSEKGELVSGKDPIASCLRLLKERAFPQGSEYPVILGFPSVEVADQEALAKILTTELGTSLAKGVMFDGSSLHSPQFTPAALTKKFLLLCPHAPLKPFLGFHVADMKCDGLGVKVTNIEDGTPAAKASISKDDWLTHIDGTSIPNREQLKQQLNHLHVGQEVSFRKETQDVAHIIVGGKFIDGPAAIKALSDLSYIGVPTHQKERFSHWECEVLPREAVLGKTSLDSHFALIQEPTIDIPTLVHADEKGVQMINTSSSEAQLWADAKFAENNRCGYILKRMNPPQTQSRFRFKPVSALRKRKQAKLITLKGEGLGGGSVVSDSAEELLVTVDSDYRVIKLTAVVEEQGQTVELTCALSSHMLRRGYHAITLYSTPYVGTHSDMEADSLVFLLQREEASSA
jgi:hypothetical protein